MLLSSISNGKSFLTIVGDNGPDMNPASYMNILYFGRIWRDLSLSRFTCVSFRSAYNPIEHAWSLLSNCLTSVTIPACLPDEDIPPCKQNLSQELKNDKTAEMLENAACTLSSYWENLTYDGNPVVPIVIKREDVAKEKYKDHNKVEEVVYASKKALDNGSNELKQIRGEFAFLCRHADRRANCFTLLKCQLFKPDGMECDWCKENPPKECPALDFEKHLGGFFFDPIQFETH